MNKLSSNAFQSSSVSIAIGSRETGPNHFILKSQLFLMMNLCLDIILVFAQGLYLPVYLTKLSSSLLLAFVGVCVKTSREELKLEILIALLKIMIIITQVIVNDSVIFASIVIILYKTNPTSKTLTLYYYFDSLIVKLACLAVIFMQMLHFYWGISVALLIIMELAALREIYLENGGLLLDSSTQYRGPPYEQSLLMREVLWKNRIQRIPVSLIMISKSQNKITFKNRTAFRFFIFVQEEGLDEFLLNQLQFKIMMDDGDATQDYVMMKSRYRLKDLNSLNNVVSSGSKNSELEQQKYTLSEIIKLLRGGKYSECFKSERNCLELYCNQILDQHRRVQVAGKIILNQDDDEIIVILNDVQKVHDIQEMIIRDEFKSRVLDSFSHELRTPLNSAINFLTSALSLSSLEEEVIQDYIKPSLSSLKLQSFLISDIIDFSHYHSRSLELNIKEFYLSDLFKELTDLYEFQFKYKDIAFTFDLIGNHLDQFSSDYQRFMQILVNLISNSVKFMDAGLIVVKVVSFRTDTLKVTIKDDGYGIEESKLRLINSTLLEACTGKPLNHQRSWNGLGLLVAQILLKELAPEDAILLKINSNGLNHGTKVRFYIKNHTSTNSRHPTLRQTQFKKSSVSLQPSNFTGTIIVGGELTSLKQKFGAEVATRLLAQSIDNSLFSNSSHRSQTVDNKMEELEAIHPLLITQVAMNPDVKRFTQTSITNRVSEGRRSQLSESYKKTIHGASSMCRIMQMRQLKQLDEESDHPTKWSASKGCSCRNRILSVDDEIFNQRSIQLLISKMGFEVMLVKDGVRQANNGEEALQLVRELRPCGKRCQLLRLILMDYQMPTLDGVAATKELRQMMQQNIIPKIHIIGLTAFTNSQDISRCLDAGMSDVLAKPLNLKEFKDILALV